MAYNYNRRSFLNKLALVSAGLPFSAWMGFGPAAVFQRKASDFAKRLSPVGRILETEGYYVWCNSPIYGDDGKVHVFYSRWPETYGMGGWIHKSEVAHAVADNPESDFEYVETILKPRPGFFDATTCHNPSIHYIDGVYALF